MGDLELDLFLDLGGHVPVRIGPGLIIHIFATHVER
jgi:hypothetical protein